MERGGFNYPALGFWAHEISRKQRQRAEWSREVRDSSERERGDGGEEEEAVVVCCEGVSRERESLLG